MTPNQQAAFSEPRLVSPPARSENVSVRKKKRRERPTFRARALRKKRKVTNAQRPSTCSACTARVKRGIKCPRCSQQEACLAADISPSTSKSAGV